MLSPVGLYPVELGKQALGDILRHSAQDQVGHGELFDIDLPGRLTICRRHGLFRQRRRWFKLIQIHAGDSYHLFFHSLRTGSMQYFHPVGCLYKEVQQASVAKLHRHIIVADRGRIRDTLVGCKRR